MIERHDTVPVLETPRLRLRGHRTSDFEACADMWSDAGVVRYITGVPSSAQQTWSRILAYTGHWSLMGFGYWAIEERESGAFVGEGGLADFKRDIVASMRDVPELGFALVPAAQGRGLATEAVRAMLDWSDSSLLAPRTVALVRPDNAASRRVLERCGYRIFERTSFNGQPSLFCERVVDR